MKAPKLLQSERDSFVILDFKLLNWKYMNFSMKFRESTHIFTIKVCLYWIPNGQFSPILFFYFQKLLRERHGRVEDLKICFTSFSETNEVNDEMLTLKQCGCNGVMPEIVIGPTGVPMFDESKVPTIPVFYDFKPSDFSDPVLLYFK